MGIELLNVPGGQLVQLDIAQGGDDVLIDPSLIGHLSVGPEVRFFIGLIPVIQPSAQGDSQLGSFGGGSLQTFPQGLQLCHTLRFVLARTFWFWEALLVIVNDDAPFPAAIFSFS